MNHKENEIEIKEKNMKKQKNDKKLTNRQKEVLFYMCSMISVIFYLILAIVIIRVGLAGIIAEALMEKILLVMGIGLTILYIVIGRKKIQPQTFMFYVVISIVYLVMDYVIISIIF